MGAVCFLSNAAHRSEWRHNLFDCFQPLGGAQQLALALYCRNTDTQHWPHTCTAENTKYKHVCCEEQLDRRNRRNGRETEKKVWPGKSKRRHSLKEMCVKSGQSCPCDF